MVLCTVFEKKIVLVDGARKKTYKIHSPNYGINNIFMHYYEQPKLKLRCKLMCLSSHTSSQNLLNPILFNWSTSGTTELIEMFFLENTQFDFTVESTVVGLCLLMQSRVVHLVDNSWSNIFNCLISSGT